MPLPDTIQKPVTYKKFGVGGAMGLFLAPEFTPDDLENYVSSYPGLPELVDPAYNICKNYSNELLASTAPSIEASLNTSAKNELLVGTGFKILVNDAPYTFSTEYFYCQDNYSFSTAAVSFHIGAKLFYKYNYFNYKTIDNLGQSWNDTYTTNVFLLQLPFGVTFMIKQVVDIELEAVLTLGGFATDNLNEADYIFKVNPNGWATNTWNEKDNIYYVCGEPIFSDGQPINYYSGSILGSVILKGGLFLKVHYRFDFKKHKK